MATKGTVLVVDDEPDIAALLVALLESEGYSPLRAASGYEALELARVAQPAGVILDLSLPDLDGIHVLRLLKEQEETAAVPVIVVSAYTGRLSATDRALVHSVFEKPFDLDELTAALAKLPSLSHKGTRSRRVRRPAATAA